MLDLFLDAADSINSITEIEYVRLLSTFYSMSEPEYNCQNCIKKYSQSVRNSKKYCSVDKKTPLTEYGEFIKFYRCPSNYRNQAIISVIDMLRQFRNGVLPFSGGLLEQPAKVFSLANALEGIEFEFQKELKKKSDKWQKARSASSYQLKKKRP